MNILQTPTFKSQVKKLHKNQKCDLDIAIQAICKDPSIGDGKKGDLGGVRVYKFKMNKQLTLLAYTAVYDELQLILLALGSHENFYRDLK
ncbi:MAG TPA: type II toxin-antitoxin system RelE/ParE family toxin [Candidatus Babeliales bacterium]|nr:type II toxin-antitoxin system RelE/ParE family toxin [Candidatus Babeliales bacterium]